MPLIPTSTGKPRVILGLMTFGPSEKDGARITDLSVYNSVLDRFQSRGYNEVDTARVYIAGQQEAFTREAKWKQRGLKLATKVKYPSEDGDHVEAKVIESVEKSLKELGTDTIDVCIHSLLCSRRLSQAGPNHILNEPVLGRSYTFMPPTARRPLSRLSVLLTSCTRPASSSSSACPTTQLSRWPKPS